MRDGELEFARLRGRPTVADPLNLTWIMPAKGSTRSRDVIAGPSGAGIFIIPPAQLSRGREGVKR